MQPINAWRFSLACGIASAFLYVGCAAAMAVLGRNSTIVFFNSLLHGLDVRLIMRMDVPLREAVIGIIETFIMGWLFGAIVASIYNLGSQEPE